MFSVASTAALVGLLAVVIPIVIHLFNPSKGKVVWVGHIELLRSVKLNSVTEKRISHWWLLLLRLAIVLLMTMLLATSYYHGDWWPAKTRALVSPSWLAQASELQFAQMQNDADEITLLTPAFKTITQKGDGELSPVIEHEFSLWTLLAQLDKQQPINEIFVVYSSNQFSEFDHPIKPPLNRQVQWRSVSFEHGVADKQPTKTVVIYSQVTPSGLLMALSLIKERFAIDDIEQRNLPQMGSERVDLALPSNALVLWLYPQAPQSKVIKSAMVALPLDWQTRQNDADFALQLMAWMSGEYPLAQRFVDARLSEAQMLPGLRASINEQRSTTPLQPYLMLLLILCWLLERYLATRPQEVQS